jgi:uncharacterized Rossmann fold enzyme
VDWAAWEPTYRAILRDFGFDPKADEAARDELDALLADRWRAEAPGVRGREVVVLGGGPRGSAPLPEGPLFVSDPRVVPPRRPDLVVTDLDGDVPLQLALNATGVPLAVHAHGDNAGALRAHVPAMRGPVWGTCQCAPRGRVANFGGFTDGDRACCLAVAFGASSLALAGFDWARPTPKPGRDATVKARKLAWARRIAEGLGVPIRIVDAA